MYELYAKIRDGLGLRDSDVCKRAGISPGTMSDWKSGRYNLKAEKLQKIADALGVPVDALMGGSSYYYDDVTARVAQELFENPDLRILFDAARGSRPEDLRTAAALLRRFKEGGSDA